MDLTPTSSGGTLRIVGTLTCHEGWGQGIVPLYDDSSACGGVHFFCNALAMIFNGLDRY
jgi:hypothetical protein